ncbi:hypothetical protein DPX16_10241 [Anabarilius grahami]|uniref:Uncharacterized protein n=1 Tax=Anabarilius grahami TaxID=495550 RepID=A0A3N0Y0K2_ANAGA|nr:hypothetical protein DPX16_10241 [Anabarilius grahami]
MSGAPAFLSSGAICFEYVDSKMASGSKRFSQFVPLCRFFLIPEDSHELCVICLCLEHAHAAVPTGCPPAVPTRFLYSKEPGSKELDVIGEPHEPRDDVSIQSGSPTSPAYGELLDVMAQAVHWLSLPWSSLPWSCEKTPSRVASFLWSLGRELPSGP